MAVRFGKYLLLHRIGVGGMAEVFVAETHGPQGFVKRVVIKRILPAFNEDPEFVRLFINEARVAAKLQHANIVQIFDFDHVEATYYIAMEWVDGTDLRRLVEVSRARKMPVPVPLAVHVGVETLKGLHYAHTRGEAGTPWRLVHRDISPHNLLVSFAGEVKIADFGIAKVAALATGSGDGRLKGKLPYMAPEQLDGRVDCRSDLYSLGIVLWELLAGRRLHPVDGGEGELIGRVKRAEIPALRTLNPGVSESLERIVRRMLVRDPAGRFPSAARALGELSGLARVGDALEVAGYLRELLPAEASREARGGTRLIGAAVQSFSEAAPDAPTRTRASLGRGQDDETSSSAAEVVGGRGRRRAGARGPWRGFGVLLGAGVLGWSLGGGQPVTGPESGSTVTLELSSAPGARLFADGVALPERRPLRLTGLRGSRLLLEARRGDQRAVRRVTLLESEQLTLHLPPADRSEEARAGGERPGVAGSRAASAAEPQEPARGGRSRATRSAKALLRHTRVRVRAWGMLQVVVEPWAHVVIDGEPAGTTPITARKTAVGVHQVELVNSELGQRERLEVEIEANRTTRVRRHWGNVR